MSQLPNVVIVMARCSHNQQGFGIRFEEKSQGQWACDWAFAVKDATASKEGYDRGEIAGAFGFDSTYLGCPHCRAPTFFKCGCGKVGCWDGERQTVTCPWCEVRIELSGQIESLGVKRDR